MTTLVFELFGKDASASIAFKKVGRSADDAGRRLTKFGDDADKTDKRTGLLGRGLNKLAGNIADFGRGAISGAATVAGLGSASLAAAPLVAKAATAVYQFGAAAVEASPALAALAAGGLFVKATFARIGPEIGKSLSPISEMLDRAGASASALATRRLPELSAGFSKANFPAVSAGMNDIAVATNGVVSRFLEWGKSAKGVEAIRNLTYATGHAMIGLGPHISRVAESFGNMVGRIAMVTFAAGERGLAGALDRLAGWMDRVNAATVANGLDKLKADYEAIRGAIETTAGWIRKATQFWREHAQAIEVAKDALGVAAIAIGISTGNIVAVVAGAAGLIIHHWDDIKAGWQSVNDYFTKDPAGIRAATALSDAWETVKPGLLNFWQQLKDKVGPVVAEIWDRIKNQLIPAVGDLIDAVAPFVKVWLDVFGPTVVAVIKGLGQAVLGLVDVITGGINVVTAVLSGDWGKAWEGAKQITRGSGEIIAGAWTATASNLVGTTIRAVDAITSGLGTIPKEITTAIKADTGNILAGAATATGSINAVPGWHNTDIVANNSQALGAISGVQAALAGLRDRYVNVVVSTVQNIAAGIPHAAGGVIPMAPGGVLPSMSGRLASIVGPNAPRIIGDRQQDDEAFIPINGSARSIGILAEAARRMGFNLSKPGAGATPGLGGLGSAGLPSLPTVNPLAIGGAGGRETRVVHELRAGDEMSAVILRMLRNAIRSQGGDVQLVLGAAD